MTVTETLRATRVLRWYDDACGNEGRGEEATR